MITADKKIKKGMIVSGYFNPLHKGHIEYFINAKQGVDDLIVIVNNDFQRKLKQSKEFMIEDERLFIVKNLKMVDMCFLSIDKDRTVMKTIELIHTELNKEYKLYFGNGGDQNNDVIPERNICNKLSIKLVDDLGGKIQSSSWILKEK
jgi:cytidyltransferase-like protein